VAKSNLDLREVDKEQLIEFTEHGQELVVCQGGFGGRGNVAFKSSRETTPLRAQYGTFGEEKLVVMELRLLADVGLVGFPNAGKSTFLSTITKAQPKVANYPFTTLSPHLGVMQLSNTQNKAADSKESVVIADIPGLISNASQGAGLGYDFLRHVTHTQVLLFMLYIPDEQLAAAESADDKVSLLVEQYQNLMTELETYEAALLDKPVLITVSKADLIPEEQQQAILDKLTTELDLDEAHQPIMFSSATGFNVDQLRSQLKKTIAS